MKHFIFLLVSLACIFQENDAAGKDEIYPWHVLEDDQSSPGGIDPHLFWEAAGFDPFLRWNLQSPPELYSSSINPDFASVMRALIKQDQNQRDQVELSRMTDGHAGLFQQRSRGGGGTDPYHTESHQGLSIASLHDHGNNIRTVGLGEMALSINGVEFLTRHNDYALYMPSNNTSEMNIVEEISFPDLPTDISSLPDLSAQEAEMREYFWAFKYDNITHRDYRKYFKPVLCYLEGAWTVNDGQIDEPFVSDRHFLEAETWIEHRYKFQYMNNVGRKSQAENYAFLPQSILDIVTVNNDGNTDAPIPLIGQWNYRILCHPVKRPLPISSLRLKDDVVARVGYNRDIPSYFDSRQARFTFWDKDLNEGYTLLDALMSEIPGKDNYNCNIEDDAFNLLAYDAHPDREGDVLNACYYHRVYKQNVNVKGVDGKVLRTRGITDSSLYYAMNTQERIVGANLPVCRSIHGDVKCKTFTQKFSYAVPLELIVLTPLSLWNPLDVPYYGDPSSPDGKSVWANGRNGGFTYLTAYNGTNAKRYYMTPASFFSSSTENMDPADTTGFTVGVLNKNGDVEIMQATGPRTLIPSIEGVGSVRTRYMVLPVHSEGSSIGEEISALEMAILEPEHNTYLYESKPEEMTNSTETWTSQTCSVRLFTSMSKESGKIPHKHTVCLKETDDATLKMQGRIVTYTDFADGHKHMCLIFWNHKAKHYVLYRCDMENKCPDGHNNRLIASA